MKNIEDFGGQCSNIFGNYLSKFKGEMKTTNNLRDKPDNLRLPHSLSGLLVKEILKFANETFENYNLPKDSTIEILI